MEIAPFRTEQFFARYEFNTPWQLCNSDCETVSVEELLSLAGVPMDQLGGQRLSYGESQGGTELREAIAAGYRTVQPDDVVLLGTPVEGIYLLVRALVEPGDEVVVLTPAYDALVNLFEHVAGKDRVHRWRVRPSGGNWTLDLDELRALLTPATRLLVVNFPHNPTGFLPTAEWQRQLVELARERGVALFADEMYFGLEHSGTPAIPSMADAHADSVVLSGLSKTYGLPGLRCGWLVVRDPGLRDHLMNWKYYTSICAPVLSEFLARVALGVRDTLRRRSIERIERNLAVADAFFARWEDSFEWRRPLAGSTALVGFDVPSVSELSHRLAREEGLLIQSAAMLGGDDRHMRIGLGRDAFATALDRFEDWLRRQ